jgi:hypothetical protein
MHEADVDALFLTGKPARVRTVRVKGAPLLATEQTRATRQCFFAPLEIVHCEVGAVIQPLTPPTWKGGRSARSRSGALGREAEDRSPAFPFTD